jgi:hypothetical protein
MRDAGRRTLIPGLVQLAIFSLAISILVAVVVPL